MSWEETIKLALKRATEVRGKPIPGALFKQAIQKISPDPLPNEKFSRFLEQYGHLVTLMPQKGSDFLVVPKGQMDLLSQEKGATKVRHDLYKAFSTITPSSRAWYHKNRDRICWLAIEDKPSDEYIAISRCTEESEVNLRKEFVKGLQTPHSDAKGPLEAALEAAIPLSAFSNEVRKYGLLDYWFNFRLEAMFTQIRQWATENKIEWQESWVTSDAQMVTQVPKFDANIELLSKHLGRLSESDLARISIPMDIVLKILKSR
jgi:hypothetical protein